MDMKEKLVELLKKAKAKEQYDFLFGDIDTAIDMPHGAEYYADYLIANGVTVQELDGCFRCKDSQKMTVTISNKLIDGVNTGWIGGNLPARFCPFCGRRFPQPPKGE
jgi:hypothetical protein